EGVLHLRRAAAGAPRVPAGVRRRAARRRLPHHPRVAVQPDQALGVGRHRHRLRHHADAPPSRDPLAIARPAIHAPGLQPPALEAQTRLMFGAYLEYTVTEKE